MKTTSKPDDYVPTLITQTPFAGRQLAITLARKSVNEMQSDPKTKSELREVYSKSASALIDAAHVIAVEFQTIALANNYWRS